MPVQTKIIGRYSIVSELGRGGMGVVYRAQHLDLGTVAALKTLTAFTGDRISCLRREIQALSHLDHPSIVKIYDHGIQDSIPWYAMEFLEGDSLRNLSLSRIPETERSWWTHSLARSRRGPIARRSGSASDRPRGTRPTISLKPVLTIMHDVCDAVSFMHGEGIIHRDLKPENILIRPDGTPVLMDFGLAAFGMGRSNREVLDLLKPGMGTLLYMAPELFHGEKADCRSDLYSIGCMLYELLTDRLPIDGADPASIQQQKLTLSITPPSRLRPSIPAGLDALIMNLLEPDPARRIGYATDVCSALRAAGADRTDPLTSTPLRYYLHRPRFTGRRQIYTQFSQRLARASVGRGSLMLVAGESGIGKTRLAIEIAGLAMRNSFQVVMGECSALSGLRGGSARGELLQGFQKPLEAIVDLCVEQGEVFRDRIMEQDAVFLAYFSKAVFESLPESTRENLPQISKSDPLRKLFRTVASILSRLAAEKPLLVIIDDLQWADELTLGVIRHMASEQICVSKRLLFLGLYRAEETTEKLQTILGLSGVESASLFRLDTDELTGIIADMLASRLDAPKFVHRLAELAEGNPFFIAEYLNGCLDSGILKRVVNGWRIETAGVGKEPELPSLPVTLKQLIAHRFTLLPPDRRHLVDVASILSRDIEPRMLQAIVRLDESTFADRLHDLTIRHFFEELPDGLIRFTHDKIREAALEQLPVDEGRDLHRTAASVIETDFTRYGEQHPYELGHHWEMAGNTDKACEYYWLASEAAIARFALSEAETFLKKILAITDSVSQHSVNARLRLGRGIYEYLGQHDRAVKIFEQTIPDAERIGNQMNVAELLFAICINAIYMGDYTRAHEAGQAAIPIFERNDQIGYVATVYGHFAAIAHRKGDFQEGLRLNHLALDLYRQSDRKDMQSWVLGNIGRIQFSLKQDKECMASLEESLRLAREAGNNLYACNTLGCMGIIYNYCSKFERAEECIREAIRIHRLDGNRRMEGQELCNLGDLLVSRGDLEDARAVLWEAESVHEEYDNQIVRAKIDVAMGRYHLARCELSEARERFERALKHFRSLEIPSYVSFALNWLAHVEMNAGRFKKYLEYSTESEKLFEKNQDIRALALCHIELARYRMLEGAYEEAERLLQSIIPDIRPERYIAEQAVLYAAMGELMIQLGRLTEARRWIDRAVRTADRNGLRITGIDARLARITIGRMNRLSIRTLSAQLRALTPLVQATGDHLLGIRLQSEAAFINHILGRSGREHLTRMETLVDLSSMAEDSPIYRLIQKVRRAVEAFEAGQALVAGQREADLPVSGLCSDRAEK